MNPKLDLNEMLTYLSAYKGRSGTACPNIHEWLEAFGDAEYVFAVTITGTLSGACHNAAVQAKDSYEKGTSRTPCLLSGQSLHRSGNGSDCRKAAERILSDRS